MEYRGYCHTLSCASNLNLREERDGEPWAHLVVGHGVTGFAGRWFGQATARKVTAGDSLFARAQYERSNRGDDVVCRGLRRGSGEVHFYLKGSHLSTSSKNARCSDDSVELRRQEQFHDTTTINSAGMY